MVFGFTHFGNSDILGEKGDSLPVAFNGFIKSKGLAYDETVYTFNSKPRRKENLNTGFNKSITPHTVEVNIQTKDQVVTFILNNRVFTGKVEVFDRTEIHSWNPLAHKPVFLEEVRAKVKVGENQLIELFKVSGNIWEIQSSNQAIES